MKWLSYTYICSFPLWFIIRYWIQFPILESKTSLFIHPIYIYIYISLHLLIPNFQCWPPTPTLLLTTTNLFSMSVTLFLFHGYKKEKLLILTTTSRDPKTFAKWVKFWHSPKTKPSRWKTDQWLLGDIGGRLTKILIWFILLITSPFCLLLKKTFLNTRL